MSPRPVIYDTRDIVKRGQTIELAQAIERDKRRGPTERIANVKTTPVTF